MTSGTIRQSHSTTTARALIGALDWSFYWLYEMKPADAARAGGAMRDLFTRGLFSAECDYNPAMHPFMQGTPVSARGFDREAQNRIKQEAFFKAGTRFFNTKGFNGTSLDEIAENLQVSKGAFYYHFANKESLLTQCYDYSMDQLEAIHSEIDAQSLNGPEKLDQACRRIFNVQNSELGPLIRYNTITALSPMKRRKVLARTERLNDYLASFIDQGVAEGLLRPIGTTVVKNLMMGAINASMDIDLWRKVDDLDSTAVDYFDVFYFGLKSV